jgi:hypothetical protein
MKAPNLVVSVNMNSMKNISELIRYWAYLCENEDDRDVLCERDYSEDEMQKAERDVNGMLRTEGLHLQYDENSSGHLKFDHGNLIGNALKEDNLGVALRSQILGAI